MVAENLRRMEMKEEALKSESKTALRKAAVTAVGGK
jgi:hypothetical protein